MHTTVLSSNFKLQDYNLIHIALLALTQDPATLSNWHTGSIISLGTSLSTTHKITKTSQWYLLRAHHEKLQELYRKGRTNLCYTLSWKYESTHLQYRGTKSNIHDTCDTGTVFSKCTVCLASYPPTYTHSAPSCGVSIIPKGMGG